MRGRLRLLLGATLLNVLLLMWFTHVFLASHSEADGDADTVSPSRSNLRLWAVSAPPWERPSGLSPVTPWPTVTNAPSVPRARHEHTFFTTHRQRVGYEGAYAKSYAALSRVPGRIMRLNHTRQNQHGYPFLKDMYLFAQRWWNESDTYTYYNADLLFNGTALTATLDALVDAVAAGKLSRRFLAVGLRRNVRWNASDDFGELFEQSKVFVDDAQDYFVTSPSLWNWSAIPDLVVGRRAYDNWLVQHAIREPGVDTVDLTATLTTLHLTVHSNRDGHAGTDHDDVDFNAHVLEKADPKWNMWLGRVSACAKRTVWRDGKVVVLANRRANHKRFWPW